MKRLLVLSAMVPAMVLGVLAPAQAARPGFVFPGGCCLYEGQQVRTVVPPSSFPGTGQDDFFAVMGGVSAQKAVVAVAPGDVGYHGGHWAFHAVTWNVAPYLLGSAEAIHDAAGAGDVTISRDPSKDFLCPIQF